jgi:galactitol-specific phosphotransferase system IIC component
LGVFADSEVARRLQLGLRVSALMLFVRLMRLAANAVMAGLMFTGKTVRGFH